MIASCGSTSTWLAFVCRHPPLASIFSLSRFGSAVVVLCLATGCEPRPLTANGVVGEFGKRGLAPGDFSYPRAITVAPDGSVFVVDKTGRIQRFSAEGVVETVWRMPETDHGKPVGLSVHPDGRIFVADTHYHRVMIFDRDGHPLGSFGSEGTGDGEFRLPTDVAVDAEGFIYVSEYGGNDRVTKWSPDLRFVRSLADGLINGSRVQRPTGIDIDNDQTLWIADACNHRIIRMSLDGEVLSVFGRFGSQAGEFRYPYDLTVAPDGTIMVCEYEGNRLQWLTKDGQGVRIWGRGGRALGELFAPWGATYGPRGRVYVVDSLNSRVQIIRL